MTEKIYHEHCLTVKHRTNFILKEELEGKVGFRSVYGYSEEAVTLLRQQATSRGMGRFEQIADVLLVDFDNQPEEAQKLVNTLKEYEIKFEVYESGNRSYHFHIPHELKRSIHLPHTHKEVLRKLGVNLDNVDLTIYRPNSIFRLPDTIHPKTGNKKVLLKAYEGELLDFNIVETPETVRDKLSVEQGEAMDLELMLGLFQKYLVMGAGEGNRYASFFAMACACADVGLDKDAAERLIEIVNNSYDNPHKTSEVRRGVDGAYLYVTGG